MAKRKDNSIEKHEEQYLHISKNKFISSIFAIILFILFYISIFYGKPLSDSTRIILPTINLFMYYLGLLTFIISHFIIGFFIIYFWDK